MLNIRLSMPSVTVALLLGALAVNAAPAPSPHLDARQSITTLSSSAIETFKPYTFYASTGYCDASVTLTWTCGTNCDANPGFEPVASGGDGDATQFWFVGFDPTLKTVIVSHQGTDTSKILPIITDADFFLEGLDSTLFPGVSSSVEAHNGFASEQAKTATDVLAAVESAMSKFGTSDVTVVGHSLGAAIALLDGIYLPLHLTDATVKVIGYGMPRVGNQAFADYVDAHISVNRINNMEDFVPILPGRFLGFHHPSGEIHIEDSGSWDSCPGQDNTSDLCTTGDVPNIFEGDESNHDGPYDGVEMGC